jgi:acyl carrier protein
MLDTANVVTRLLTIVREFAHGLPASDAQACKVSLPEAGLTSMAAVKLMLAIEAEFGIAIPDSDLTPENFADVQAVEAMVERLRAN